jgi:CRISPR-associated protein Cas5t
VLLNAPKMSVVLRTVWRVKKTPLGSPGNTRPDYQQLLTGPSRDEPFVALVVWVDSVDEADGATTLETRVCQALTTPAGVTRFGGLSLGESTHLVDEVNLLEGRIATRLGGLVGQAFLTADRGRLTLPVWVDHVGSAGTRYATGNLESGPIQPPPLERMPRIAP